jgi:hypothetical protein
MGIPWEMRAEGEQLSIRDLVRHGCDSPGEIPDSLACGSASGMTGEKDLGFRDDG